jgi:hypothetical protein
MTGRVVMDSHGPAAHFAGAARNLTLSRRPAGTAPAEPRLVTSFGNDLSPPHGVLEPERDRIGPLMLEVAR